MNYQHQSTAVVGLNLPHDLIRAVDDAAGRELISRAAWIRRTVVDRLRSEGAIPAISADAVRYSTAKVVE